MQQEAQAVDALEAVLAVLDDELLSKEDDEVLKTAIKTFIFCRSIILRVGSNLMLLTWVVVILRSIKRQTR